MDNFDEGAISGVSTTACDDEDQLQIEEQHQKQERGSKHGVNCSATEKERAQVLDRFERSPQCHEAYYELIEQLAPWLEAIEAVVQGREPVDLWEEDDAIVDVPFLLRCWVRKCLMAGATHDDIMNALRVCFKTKGNAESLARNWDIAPAVTPGWDAKPGAKCPALREWRPAQSVFLKNHRSHGNGKQRNISDSATRSDIPLPTAASTLSSSLDLPPSVSLPGAPETVVRPLGATFLKTNQHLGGHVHQGQQSDSAQASATAAGVKLIGILKVGSTSSDGDNGRGGGSAMRVTWEFDRGAVFVSNEANGGSSAPSLGRLLPAGALSPDSSSDPTGP